MFKHVTISVIIVLLVSVSSAYAEKSTELYIPIDQSPGLSGQYTVTGKIDQVNSQNQTIKLLAASSGYTVKLTQRTFVYLDRSKVKLINTYGTLVDCKLGDTIEVKWENDDPAKPAEWIKVEKMH